MAKKTAKKPAKNTGKKPPKKKVTPLRTARDGCPPPVTAGVGCGKPLKSK